MERRNILTRVFFLTFDDDYYNQGYGQIEEAFKALTKDDTLQPYISDHNFRSSIYNDIGYNVYIFDTLFQKNFESAQATKVEFKISENVPAVIYGDALVLTNRLISIGSDGQRHFDLI